MSRKATVLVTGSSCGALVAALIHRIKPRVKARGGLSARHWQTVRRACRGGDYRFTRSTMVTPSPPSLGSAVWWLLTSG